MIDTHVLPRTGCSRECPWAAGVEDAHSSTADECILRAVDRNDEKGMSRLDYMIPLNERHLRKILSEWVHTTTEAARTLAWGQECGFFAEADQHS